MLNKFIVIILSMVVAYVWSVSFSIFETETGRQFILYRSDAAIDMEKRTSLQQSLGLMKRFIETKKKDEDYNNLIQLNDPQMLQRFISPCNLNMKPVLVSNYITMTRYKTLGYFLLEFDSRIAGYATCILDSFNDFILKRDKYFLQLRKKEVAEAVLDNPNQYLMEDAMKLNAFYEVMSGILESIDVVYKYHPLDYQVDKEPTYITSSILAVNVGLLVLFVLVIFHRLKRLVIT